MFGFGKGGIGLVEIYGCFFCVKLVSVLFYRVLR